jgi:hypothetical protein
LENFSGALLQWFSNKRNTGRCAAQLCKRGATHSEKFCNDERREEDRKSAAKSRSRKSAKIISSKKWADEMMLEILNKIK